MIVTRHPFTVPLVAPLTLAGRTYAARAGVLLRVEVEDRVGWGEASPLPGFSPETLEEARDTLDALDPDTLEQALVRFPDEALPDLPAAARAAAETALLDLTAQRHGTTMARVLAPNAASTVEVNGLITAESADEVARQVTRLVAQGYTAVKLKVGRRPVEADVLRVRAAAGALPPGTALRLDANRAWARAEAEAFAEAVAGISLAYVEEPVAHPADLAAVARVLPVALDESLVQADVSVLDAHPYARAVVLKPMLLGGPVAAWRWAQAARARGMEAVVSAAFEAGVGTRANVALAAALGGTPPAGLDPYRHLAADVFATRLPLDGPRLVVADVLGARSLRLDG